LGVRTRLQGAEDLNHDKDVGFEVVLVEEADRIGMDKIAERVIERVKGPVYLR
jgi:hypothetical protein